MIPFVIVYFALSVLKNGKIYWDYITGQPICISAPVWFFLEVLRDSLHTHVPQNTLKFCGHTHCCSQSMDSGLSGPRSWCDIQLLQLERQLPGHRMSEQAWQAQPVKCTVHACGVQILACCAQRLGELAHPAA